jgi:hypothetical protein
LKRVRFQPAASSDTRPFSATHGFRVLPITAEPSGCPFPCRSVIPGQSVIQALKHNFQKKNFQFQINRGQSLSFSEAL